MKILGYFVFLQIGMFWALYYSCKYLEQFTNQEWVNPDDVRDGFVNQMRIYVWTFVIGSLVLAGCFTHWLATEFLTQFPKHTVLLWLFTPVAVGYMTAYITIFESAKIFRLLKDPETRYRAMSFPIMRTPTLMRKFWVGSGVALATAGIATMMMLEFLN
jgi:hypothetical protein